MLFGYGRTAVGAAIIDENDLDITIGLVENTANGALERALGVVEDSMTLTFWLTSSP